MVIKQRTKNDIKQLIEDVRQKYKSIGHVYCPVLCNKVYFNSDGFRHLIYKANRKKRNVAEQEYKLRLFALVIPVIKNAKEIAEWRFQGTKDNPREIHYYALCGRVGRKSKNIRVIIRRTGDGQFNFYSVMPEKK